MTKEQLETNAPPAARLGRSAWLPRLGHAPDARLLVVHVDDIGMCHAANVGAFAALDAGPASCGSLMVPCPWFAEAAEMAAERPSVDLGVHLTLNAEWQGYRWGPVAGSSAVPSLCASDGALHRSVGDVIARADPDEVELELRAQIERALAAGIDVTHLDSHMGTVLTPRFIGVYARLLRDYRLPGCVAQPARGLPPGDPVPSAVAPIVTAIDGLEADGFPVFDHFDADSLSFAEGGGRKHNLARLADTRSGLNFLIIHAAAGGDELDALPESMAHCRAFEAAFYASEAGRRAIEAQGCVVIGMRAIRDAMRAELQ